MTTRMLIDATHSEETRVVVVRGSRLEEFDFESSTKKQNKGNIYLARVTRVEPSLQAAFVEYGANRHGFLAFSEIHPDYYQIPVADRQALLEEEAALAAEDARLDDEAAEAAERREAESEDTVSEDVVEVGGADNTITDLDENGVAVSAEGAADEQSTAADGETTDTEADADEANADDSNSFHNGGNGDNGDVGDDSARPAIAAQAAAAPEIKDETAAGDENSQDAMENGVENHGYDEAASAAADANANADTSASEDDAGDDEDDDMPRGRGEEVGGDALDEAPRPRTRPHRSYKIQEVIKKRQVILIQVVKEERGNKGAALTTYLSLAGRYCVLMPNTARGGGISRKIASQTARRKLKKVLNDLDVPEGMGVIVRTAGMNRTKAEIKRDYDYLFRVWDTVRDLTLESQAPTLVYEEGNLIKRAIRDLYTKDVDEVWVEGENGYRIAKDFMRMLVPSHAKKVQPYRDKVPLYHRYQVHQQLDAMHSNTVTLKSGGYLVISPTEALVSVDVNSGRSTKGHNIEDTAVRTNLEAAEELARHLRLRDLAGLIVIDFIDMEENRNNRAVERKFKECLKSDRARLQVGRISNFGLLEMSRQRLRPSLQEASSVICHHCEGTGFVRSTESTALHVLRAMEEEGFRDRASEITVHVPTPVALYMLNFKREILAKIEGRYEFSIIVLTDDELIPPNFRIDIDESKAKSRPVVIEPLADEASEKNPESDTETETEDGAKRKRRRRRRRKRDDQTQTGTETPSVQARNDANVETDKEADAATKDDAATPLSDDEDAPKRRRKRGRRGGRRRSRAPEDATVEAGAEAGASQDGETPTPAPSAEMISDNDTPEAAVVAEKATDDIAVDVAVIGETDTAPTQPGPVAAGTDADVAPEAVAQDAPAEAITESVAEAASEAANATVQPDREADLEPAPEPDAEPVPEQNSAPAKPKRRGWWQRAFDG